MEDGTASTGGSGVRRKTVSTPFPRLEDDEHEEGHIRFSDGVMRLPWNTPPASPPSATTPTGHHVPSKPIGHKRTFSGNIFARLSFLKSSGEDGRPPSRGEKDQPLLSPKRAKSAKSRKSIDDDNDTAVSPVSPEKGESAMTAALKAGKTRKRKGSLRKTALLGGRKLVTESRERTNSFLQRNPSHKKVVIERAEEPMKSDPVESEKPEDEPTRPILFSQENDSASSLRNKFSYENVKAVESSDSGWSESAAANAARLSLLTEHKALHGGRKASKDLSSPLDVKSPTSQASYASTTDDDDVLSFDRPANGYIVPRKDSLSLKKPLSTAATSYFPSISETSLTRRLSSKQRSSPLSHNMTTLSSFPEPEPHDYTETEYWGWVILFVTWLTFTVGMGSCLEIWSWAWDVGETPYAPPELEDDITLPIVGYYPALIVLTGVVAWVWITVAWIGMKYFRHAKIEV